MSAKPSWAQRHIDKWERINGTIPGLQFIDVDQKHFEIRCSLPGFEEGLIVGRPEQQRIILPTQSERDRAVRMNFQPPQAKIVVDPEVDVPDEDIDRVLACWREGEFAAGLFGVKSMPKPPATPQGGGWAAR